MPLDNYYTRPDFSRQIKQYSGTTATLSGQTNILEKFSIKNIEVDTNGALAGDALLYDSTYNKFRPAQQGSFSNIIFNGLILTYNSGLTYNVSSGSYRINNLPYTYTGGTVNILSGHSSYSRFDVVYITSAKTPTVLSGTPSAAPVIPLISSATEVQIGIISVPALFTGGTGSTILQVTSNTVFDYYVGGSGIQRAGAFNAQASGQFSFAPSKDSRAYGENSIAMGIGSIASGFSQTVVGQYNIPNTNDIFIIGNGIDDSNRANAFSVDISGDTNVKNNLLVNNNITAGSLSATTISGLSFAFSEGSYFNTLSSTTLTANTIINLPNKDGTVALLDDLTGFITGNYLPLSGGTLTGEVNSIASTTDFGYLIGKDNDGNILAQIRTNGDNTEAYLELRNSGVTKSAQFNLENIVASNVANGSRTFTFPLSSGTLARLEDITGGISGTYVSGLTSAGTGNIVLLSSITNNNLIHKSISAGTGMQITESNGTLLFVSTATGGTSSTGSTSGTSLGNGVKVLFSSNTTNLAFATLSSLTPSTLSIISSSTGVILFSATTGSGGTLTGNFLPLSGGTLTGGLSATTISATSIDRINYIDFNTGATQSPLLGRVYFDGTEQALTYYGQTNTPVRLGQQLYSRVINNSGALIPKGSAVKITGATSGLPAINLAIADHVNDNRVAGITVLDIDNGATGLIITKGLFSGLTLNNYSVGDSLFLSPFSAGTYTSSTTSFPSNSRVNRLGRVIATGTTTGQIFVDISNEDNTLSLTSIERNILEGNVISTGTYEYTGLTLGTGKTINIAPLRGWIVQNTYANATSPDVTNIYYSGGTNVTVTNLASAESTYLLINSASTLVQQTTFPTPQERRQNIFIGKVVHPDKVNITSLNQTVDFDVSPMSAIRDLWTPIKLINQGIVVSYYSSGTMNIQTSSGTLWGNGIGWVTNQLNPDSVTISGTSPTTFQYRSRNGAITGSTGLPLAPTGNTTTIDGHHYDLNGSIVAVGGNNRATNQRVYLFPTGLIRIQYGQFSYATMAAAIAGIDTEVYNEYSNNRDNGILIGILTVREDASNLADTNDGQFRFVSKFGELFGGSAGVSTTTLQQAYDNSSFPVEILTNSTLGALHVKNGTGNPDSASTIFETINSLGTSTAFMRADGTISGLTFLGDASNLTGVLSKTLLTANIPVTSQVAQVNTFYLYDKLTITSVTSSVTVTSITSDASISIYTPSIKFFANTGVTVTFKNSTILKTEGGLDAIIVGNNYDNITFTYNNNIQKYFQTNINNYI